GRSWRDGRPGTRVLAEALPPTLARVALVLLVAAVAGIAAACWSGVAPGSGADRALRLAAAVGLAVPPAWGALLVIGLWWRGGGTTGSGALASVLVLAAVPPALFARHGRALLFGAHGAPFV